MKAEGTAVLTIAISLLLGPATAPAQEEQPHVLPSKTIHDQTAKRSQEVVGQLLKMTTPQTPYDYVNFYLSGPVVVLTGFTTKAPLRNEAERLVGELDWVVHVVNEIEILAQNRQTRQMRRQVLGMLMQAAPQSFPENHANIRIKVTEKFAITLVGVVEKADKATFEVAVTEIKNLPLVSSVTSQVVVAKD
jgi:hypothetical protein